MADEIVGPAARPVHPQEMERWVSLREFEQRLHTIQIQYADQVRHLREMIAQREDALEKAITTQNVEVARRLIELNHAHEHAIENWRQSLPRETFHTTVVEWQKWRDNVNSYMNARQSMPSDIAALEVRLTAMENAITQATGALVLIRFMGFAGVIALIVTFLRMARVIP